MAARLNLPIDVFYARYTRDAGHTPLLREVDTEFGKDCILLSRDAKGKALCTVYEARPTQCKTWPFWPENLESRDAWLEAKRDAPCAGMESGELHTEAYVTQAAAEDEAATALILREATQEAERGVSQPREPTS